MQASTWLKFGTCIEGLRADISINFGANLLNIQGLINNFTYKSVGLLSSLQVKPLQGTS